MYVGSEATLQSLDRIVVGRLFYLSASSRKLLREGCKYLFFQL